MGRDYILRDLGSSNGTFVNGKRVAELRLRDGDEISLGTSKLVFHTGETAAPSASPPVPGAPGASPGRAAPRVTVVAQSHSIPAFLAQMDQQVPQNFRPAEQIQELATLKREYEKLRIAYEFHRQVSQQGKQEDLFEQILAVAFQLLAADHGVILKPGSDGQFTPVAMKHRQGSPANVMVSDTVLQKVAETQI